MTLFSLSAKRTGLKGHTVKAIHADVAGMGNSMEQAGDEELSRIQIHVETWPEL